VDGHNQMKEVKIIKNLTEKLKNEGDVSQEEADLVYMLRRIYEAYCISTFTKSMNTRQKVSGFPSLKSNLYDVAVSFDFTGSFIDPMCSAFREWYKTVVDLVSSGRTGNFVTTIPVVDSCRRWNRKEKDTAGFMKLAVAGLSEEDSLTEIKGERAIETLPQTKKLLSFDVMFSGASSYLYSTLTFSRYGLLSRLERSTSDILFLQEMTEKLKRENDISLEEADMIFTIIKFFQTFKVHKLRYCNEKNSLELQANTVKSSLLYWFKEVYQTVKSGKSGNFLYALPVSGLSNMGRSLTYIRKTLDLLPDQFFIAKLPKKPELPDMAGVFFDEERNVLLSQRYGVIREVAKADRYAVFPDDCGSFYRLEELEKARLKENFDENEYAFSIYTFFSKNKISPSVVKSQYLRKKGILPVCLFCQPCNWRDKYYLAYKKEDRDAVEKIFKIPNEALLSEFPEIPYPYEREIFLKALDKSLYVLKLYLPLIEADPDDSWADVIR